MTVDARRLGTAVDAARVAWSAAEYGADMAWARYIQAEARAAEARAAWEAAVEAEEEKQ